LLVPVVGMTAAWLLISEVPTTAELAGGLLLLGGVATAVLQRRAKPGDLAAAEVRQRLGAGLR
jgi:O-acetylserine/cysteine efflux transporter